MFGLAIISSILDYVDLMSGVASVEENLTFSTSDDWSGIGTELLQLGIVFLYLYWRRFDFSQWKIKSSWKTIGFGIFIYLVVALIMDVSSLIFGFYQFPLTYTGEFITLHALFNEVNFSLILFSIVNGFFEEIFFLGICLSVKKEHIKYALPYTLVVRTLFHLYQGLASALTIGVVIGLFFYYAYAKYAKKNLAPVVVAHMISDILGAGILWLLLY